MKGIKAAVLPAIADHRCLLVTIPAHLETNKPKPRLVSDFANADWDRLEALLADHDWDYLANCDPSSGAAQLTADILRFAKTCIQQRYVRGKCSTHPWLTPSLEQLFRKKTVPRPLRKAKEQQPNAAQPSQEPTVVG